MLLSVKKKVKCCRLLLNFSLLVEEGVVVNKLDADVQEDVAQDVAQDVVQV